MVCSGAEVDAGDIVAARIGDERVASVRRNRNVGRVVKAAVLEKGVDRAAAERRFCSDETF